MKKILVFGGTSEGRTIAENLSHNNLEVHVSVATDYGREVLEENERLHILEGRLDLLAMEELCKKEKYDLVIDATHPFAKEVSANVRKCASSIKLPLIRFERNIEGMKSNDLIYAEDALQCRDLLLQTTGKILLTTGSKDLKTFCSIPELRERITARILPAMESLSICKENKLEGNQIIAMQGPFSVEMNRIQIKDLGISILVTKESGKAGGTDAKIQAALDENIKCIVVRNTSTEKEECNPKEKYIKCSSLKNAYERLEEILGLKISDKRKINLHLIGIGMGDEKTMTIDAAEKISTADCIFGAERLLEGIKSGARKYPYYLSKDIIPVLEESMESADPYKTVCILFSGDSGFFSGAAKLKKALEEIEGFNVNVIPGISSMSYLSSKSGIPYQDAEPISLHGIEKKIWQPKLQAALSSGRKAFLLTSGLKDIHEVAKLILNYNDKSETNFKMAVGFMLSYENEKVEILKPEDCLSIKEEGLYSAFVFQD